MFYICANSIFLKKVITYLFISILTLSYSVESSLYMMKLIEQNTIACNHDIDCDAEDSECDDTPEKKIKLFVTNDINNDLNDSFFFIGNLSLHYHQNQKIDIKGYIKSIYFPPDVA